MASNERRVVIVVFKDRANFGIQVSTNMKLAPSINSADFNTDGSSNTALFSENLTAAPWTTILYGYPAAAGQPDSNIMVWLHVTEGNLPAAPNPLAHVANVMRINYKGPPASGVETWRPSSRHPGGVIMAFADGSARFVTQEIQYHVYQALLTPNNRQSDMPQRGYVYSGSDAP